MQPFPTGLYVNLSLLAFFTCSIYWSSRQLIALDCTSVIVIVNSRHTRRTAHTRLTPSGCRAAVGSGTWSEIGRPRTKVCPDGCDLLLSTMCFSRPETLHQRVAPKRETKARRKSMQERTCALFIVARTACIHYALSICINT